MNAAGHTCLPGAESEPLQRLRPTQRRGPVRSAAALVAKAHYGIGPLTAVVILAEIGDTRSGSPPLARSSATPA